MDVTPDSGSEKYDHTTPPHIRTEGRGWLDGAEQEWSELLADSDANPLFMGWDWQQLWWCHFGARLPAELLIVSVRDGAGRLVGLAPLSRRRASARRPRVAWQLAPVGNVWRTGIGEVTEYIDWIARSGHEAAVRLAISDYLVSETDWDEFICAYTQPNSTIARGMESVAVNLACYVRGERPMPHYAVDTTRSYEEYLARLSGTRRRKLHGRRGHLAAQGTVSLVPATEDNFSVQLDKLEMLSRKRWNNGFSAGMRQFYEDLGARYLQRGSLRFSTLEIAGRPVSAQFDIVARDTVYNLRSAIDASFDRHLSPGLLHIGYCIEAACMDPSIASYNLLAGGGKRTDFKRHLADRIESFESFQLIRRTDEKAIFRIYDAVARLLRP